MRLPLFSSVGGGTRSRLENARTVGAASSFVRGGQTLTATDSILARMRRAGFRAHRFEIPVGSGTQIQTLPQAKCCRCGEKASRAEYRLSEKKLYRFCWACR